MVLYKLRGANIIKDGHTMFKEDVVRDLNRLSYLEDQRIKNRAKSRETILMSLEIFDKLINSLSCSLCGLTPSECIEMEDCKGSWIRAIKKDNKEKGIKDGEEL